MTCTRCGCDTHRRVCVDCSRMDRAEEDSRSGDLQSLDQASECFNCGETAPDGVYSEDRPGVWLCRDCSGVDREEDVSTEAAA